MALEDQEVEIDVEEIMSRIRENIRRRKEASHLQENQKLESNDIDRDLNRDLNFINSNWDVKNNEYHISSHRPMVGKPLVKGRELVHNEVRRYVDPVIQKQTEFNASMVRILNNSTRTLDEIRLKVEVLETNSDRIKAEVLDEIGTSANRLRAEVDELGTSTDQLRAAIPGDIQKEVRTVLAALSVDIEKKAWLADILQGRIEEGFNITHSSSGADESSKYFVFEDLFRGSRESVKEKQSVFLPFYQGCENVLDIGCGRGEFLELLNENRGEGHGIDLDEDMVNYCVSKGLDVEKIDAIAYLEKVDDKSLDGIFLDQVVEHLEPDYLVRMLRLCYKKLKYGYYIIAETLNPLSLVSFSSYFNMDLTHKKPIHPETLKFLFSSAGFREIEIKFYSPVNDEVKLRKIDAKYALSDEAKSFVEHCNYNLDILNNILYGPQDYAVIGKK